MHSCQVPRWCSFSWAATTRPSFKFPQNVDQMNLYWGNKQKQKTMVCKSRMAEDEYEFLKPIKLYIITVILFFCSCAGTKSNPCVASFCSVRCSQCWNIQTNKQTKIKQGRHQLCNAFFWNTRNVLMRKKEKKKNPLRVNISQEQLIVPARTWCAVEHAWTAPECEAYDFEGSWGRRWVIAFEDKLVCVRYRDLYISPQWVHLPKTSWLEHKLHVQADQCFWQQQRIVGVKVEWIHFKPLGEQFQHVWTIHTKSNHFELLRVSRSFSLLYFCLTVASPKFPFSEKNCFF